MSVSVLSTPLGSPPPTRGTQDGRQRKATGNRITPAYAGNTYVNDRAIVNDRDHPRLRGEHTLKAVLIEEQGGSPPPTRGTQ